LSNAPFGFPGVAKIMYGRDSQHPAHSLYPPTLRQTRWKPLPGPITSDPPP